MRRTTVTGFASRTALMAMAALLTLLAVGLQATAADKQQAPAQGGQQISQKVGKLLVPAHEAMTKEQWDEAMNLLQQAQALDGRTDFENFQIGEMLAFVQVRKQQYAEAAATFERGLKSGFLPPDKVDERLRILTQLNYETKNYAKAVEFGGRLLGNLKQPDPELRSLVGRAQYLTRDFKGAVDTMQRASEEARAAGKPPNETWLQVQLSSYVELKDSPGILNSLEQLAVEFPKKKYWEDLFRMLKRQPDTDPRVLLNLYRLMLDTNMMQEADDYVQMGRTAMRMGIPGEAVAVLEQGKTNKAFSGEVNEELGRQTLQEAKQASIADKKALASLEQEAKAGKKGEVELQLGIAYMSYGQYDKAIEAIQRGQKKGGLKYPGEADLVLGRILNKLNRKSDATAAFANVVASKPSDEAGRQLGLLAKLWSAYLRDPSAVST